MLGVLSLAVACAAPARPPSNPGFQPPVVVSSQVTLAKPAMDPELELDLLHGVRTPPALLRSAFLQLQLRRAQKALDATAQVLYGAVKPSGNDESFARYLRGEAFDQQGRSERARPERERAAELALDAGLRALLAARLPSAEGRASVAEAELVVQPRSAWQARPADPGNITPMGRIHRLTIHHSALYFRDTRPATCAAQIQRIQREHMQGRDFGDIGYHYLIDPSGRIWAGRDLRYQGAHASGDHNVGNIGICVLGNFVRGRNGQAPPAAQVRALRQLTAALACRHGIPPDAVYSHSDFKATECPGAQLQPVIDQLVRDLHRRGAAALADTAAGQ